MLTTPFTFADALAHALTTAKTQLPDTLHGRLDAAVDLIEHHAVEMPLDDGPALVHSRTRMGIAHTVRARWCSCEDAHFQAEHGVCAHRLAVGLTRKAAELLRAQPEGLFHLDLDGAVVAAGPLGEPHPAAAPLPEAPCSVNVRVTIHGRDVQITLRGVTTEDVLARLEDVLQRYPLPPPSTCVESPPMSQPLCRYHGAMKASTKVPGTFHCTKRLQDGSYCGERFPAKGGSRGE